MEQIQLDARYRIRDGKRKEFEAIVAELNGIVRADEPDVVQYLWYFSPDGATCHVRETFTTSNALLLHVQRVGPLIERLFAVAELELTVFGDASKPLRDSIEAFGAPVYTFHSGVDRLLNEA